MNINIPIWTLLLIINIGVLFYIYRKAVNSYIGLEPVGNWIMYYIGILVSIVFWVTWIVRGLIK